MIYYLPLEYLEKRYTKDLDRLLVAEFDRRNLKFRSIEGEMLSRKIETGAFLDCDSTNYFKFSQLQRICQLFKANEIKNGDVFFTSDIWFPGIEAIKYMAMFHGLKVTVGGISHAGSWTETDFVRELEGWARDIEIGWFKMYDFVCLGSKFAKSELIEKGVAKYFRRLHVTGIPYDFDKVKTFSSKEKENNVILAGRLDDEKQPWAFDWLENEVKGAKFIRTMDLDLSKEDYYRLLGKSKVIFSAALQENFGFSVIEAVTLGCLPVLPDRLSYREFFNKGYRYKTLKEAKKMIEEFLEVHHTVAGVNYMVERHKYNVKEVVDVIEKHL